MTFTSAVRQIARQTGLSVRAARAVGSQHGYQHLMITLAGGQRAFAKVAAQEEAPAEIGAAFAAEANGLRWLAEADAVPVPEVLAVTDAALVISMIPPGHATPFGGVPVRRRTRPAARRRGRGFRRSVAGVHRQPAPGQHAGQGPDSTGRSGTPAAVCCPTSGWQWTPARSGRRTAAWWKR